MALTQMQLIQSLGEAMAWFERELSWGVPPTELRHLCGRIGELYAALITNGQMAVQVNQRGYDVVSGVGERISVKTTATMGNGGQISFNANTFEYVDRVIVLRINTEEMQVETLLDVPIADVLTLMTSEGLGKRTLSLGRLAKKPGLKTEIKSVNEVTYQGHTIRELETGSMELERDGVPTVPVKPELRELALRLNVGLLNSNGNPLNTRQLGTQIIRSVRELNATVTQQGVQPDGTAD
jgi:uncharacterized protein DUF6998